MLDWLHAGARGARPTATRGVVHSGTGCTGRSRPAPARPARTTRVWGPPAGRSGALRGDSSKSMRPTHRSACNAVLLPGVSWPGVVLVIVTGIAAEELGSRSRTKRPDVAWAKLLRRAVQVAEDVTRAGKRLRRQFPPAWGWRGGGGRREVGLPNPVSVGTVPAPGPAILPNPPAAISACQGCSRGRLLRARRGIDCSARPYLSARPPRHDLPATAGRSREPLARCAARLLAHIAGALGVACSDASALEYWALLRKHLLPVRAYRHAADPATIAGAVAAMARECRGSLGCMDRGSA